MRKKCKRRNCRFYNQNMDNNCVALQDLYENAYDCKFHKFKNEKQKLGKADMGEVEE